MRQHRARQRSAQPEPAHSEPALPGAGGRFQPGARPTAARRLLLWQLCHVAVAAAGLPRPSPGLRGGTDQRRPAAPAAAGGAGLASAQPAPISLRRELAGAGAASGRGAGIAGGPAGAGHELEIRQSQAHHPPELARQIAEPPAGHCGEHGGAGVQWLGGRLAAPRLAGAAHQSGVAGSPEAVL